MALGKSRWVTVYARLRFDTAAALRRECLGRKVPMGQFFKRAIECLLEDEKGMARLESEYKAAREALYGGKYV